VTQAAYRTMLDTNIVSDLIRNPAGVVAARLAEHGEGGICLSIITAAELRYGAAKRGSARLLARVEGILDRVDVLPFDKPGDDEYGTLRAHLEGQGTPIGPTDLLIAAHALALKVVLVTDNVGEFRRVPGLKVENWMV
jgi:tRNA(fMet)-specific endonuclease VapC